MKNGIKELNCFLVTACRLTLSLLFKHQIRLTSKAVEPSSSMLTLLELEGWTRWLLEFPSNLNHSVIPQQLLLPLPRESTNLTFWLAAAIFHSQWGLWGKKICCLHLANKKFGSSCRLGVQTQGVQTVEQGKIDPSCFSPRIGWLCFCPGQECWWELFPQVHAAW